MRPSSSAEMDETPHGANLAACAESMYWAYKRASARALRRLRGAHHRALTLQGNYRTPVARPSTTSVPIEATG
ncbi:hypothetical protein GCM10027579_12160 [Calidifontibacter terrae]